jgi:rhodanese-related sulfurtransferase
MKDGRMPAYEDWIGMPQEPRVVRGTLSAANRLSSLPTNPATSASAPLKINRGSQRRFSILSPQGIAGGFSEPQPQVAPTFEPTRAISYLIRTLESVPSATHSGSTDNAPSERVFRRIDWGTIAAEAAAMLQRASSGPNVYESTLQDLAPRTREVSTAEILKILSEGSATVFDGRTRLEYAIGHIPGALSVAQKAGSLMSQYVSDVVEIGRAMTDQSAPIILYCNGPFCGKSKRLGEELMSAGFSNVRRYQLGTPAWRALVGPMEIESEGVRYIQKSDQTAVFLDARNPEEYAAGSLPGARNLLVGDIVAAKDDGRLPMDDFNTRVVVFGRVGDQALELAARLCQSGFNNVKFYAGTFPSLITELRDR